LRHMFAQRPADRIKLRLCLVGKQKDEITSSERRPAP
jgi:hypothetical protein